MGKIQYQIKSVEERVRYIDMVVPVYFELEHPVGRHVLISWNFGVLQDLMPKIRS